ncbi:signal peptidase I [Tissierella sp. Yu-01]|uniref:signal peptidase I n=1 Tax=Tissierella sp. Yu-01 TaxID=3035694 RepID=UPI00240D0A42|nr:signal peptidase I [Tissierella sp. Yu-01]WFA07697.1 signal peptidase I [Tissierella sp. Yu-01]
MNYNFNYKPKKSFIKTFLEWSFTLVIAIVVSLFIVSNIISITQIKEQSMEPTFKENDRVIINKFVYLIGEPLRGDIIILNKVNDEKGLIINMFNEGKDIIANIKYRFTGEIEKNNLIKRVIGIEGDIIDIENGYILINGKQQEENYVSSLTEPDTKFEYPIEVPTGKVFVLGDNRENSLDSRHLGFIDIEQIKGKAIYRVFPFGRIGAVD